MNKEKDEFLRREQEVYKRIKSKYEKKLNREVPEYEIIEIANNLLHFAKTIYGS